MSEGRCLCGKVSYQVHVPLQNAAICHCSQCRRQSGHVWASAQVPVSELTISGEVRWFDASEMASRGFCDTCGSFLFWKAHDEDMISVALGSLDAPTDVKLEKHIFCADKGDYYAIADDLPQKP